MSLHTKYRPKTFDEVIGHEEVIDSLREVVDEGRAKAFIFTGPSGVGKTTLARILANEFAGGHAVATNVIEIDAATNTGVDAVRQVASHALYKAIGETTTKTIIMDEAHMLSKSAWTALLKPIEEPPKHVYWMFCTTDEGKIPDTIKTRCLSYDLKPLTEDEIEELLNHVINEEDLDTINGLAGIIAEQSEGSPRQALTFLEKCKYCETPQEVNKLLSSGGQSKEIIDLCRFLIKGRGRSWNDAMKLLKKLEGQNAESIRIVIVNYFSKAIMNTKKDKEALRLLQILEAFETSYNQSDKFGPLILSIAEALNLE